MEGDKAKQDTQGVEDSAAVFLPNEVWDMVISFLERDERFRLGLVCKCWREFSLRHNRVVCEATQEEAKEYLQLGAEAQRRSLLSSYKCHSDVYLRELNLFATAYLDKNLFDPYCYMFYGTEFVYPVLEFGKKHRDAEALAVILGGIMILARDDDNEMLISEKDGINLVIQAMKKYPDHVGVQANGCCSLCNLSYNSANERAVFTNGGIPLVINALRNHLDNPLVQHQGAAAVRNLCINYRKPLLAEGALDLVLAGMQRHPEHALVQRDGCAALKNLAYESPKVAEEVLAKGGGLLVLQAMDNHINHAAVQEKACETIRNLFHVPSPSEHWKPLIREHGVCDKLQRAMDKHPELSAQRVAAWLINVFNALVEE